MKTTINHLPAKKQSELKQIIAIIRQHTNHVVMVILFGSYARGEYKEEKDLAPVRKPGHASDYNILVVTRKQETVIVLYTGFMVIHFIIKLVDPLN